MSLDEFLSVLRDAYGIRDNADYWEYQYMRFRQGVRDVTMHDITLNVLS